MAADAESSVEATSRDLLQEEIISEIEEQLTDAEDEDEFVRKYGAINFQYIKKPRNAVWFIRPHALNYFKDGVLFRTKGERTSAKTELFLDLIYVAIIANIAGDASEHASWGALLRYVLVFIPYWTVWADIKDFTNYYYNEDLSQRTYILWILCLLTLSVNSQSGLLESVSGAAFTIVPYILCRLSLAVSLLVYSFYIPEHRAQQRLYFVLLLVTSCVWIPVIFVSTRVKIAIAVVAIVLEQVSFCIVFHPRTKLLMKLTTSTALNIEHEVERLGTFVTIALGEFLYKVASTESLGVGFTVAFGRACFMLIIAYTIFWLYYNGGTSDKAVHPLRHSALRAILWIYSHIPLIGGIVLAADASGELLNRALIYGSEHGGEAGSDHADHLSAFLVAASEALESASEEEPSLRALLFFFTGGTCVALICIAMIGLLDECEDEPDIFVLSKFWRIIWRVPAGVLILILSIFKMDLTLLFGLVALILVVLWVFESIVSVPKKKWRS